MGYKIRLVAAVSVMALLTSACLLSIKGFSVSRKTIAAGQKAVVTLQLFPTVNTSENLKAVPFVLVGQEDFAPQMTFPGSARVFDAKENYGSAPRALTKDDQMRDALMATSACGDYPVVDDADWVKTLFRTEGKVNVKNRVNKVALTKIPMKMPNGADLDSSIAINWVMIAGMWADDSENGTVGQPDTEDAFFCTSMVQSNFAVGDVSATEIEAAND